MRVLIPALVVLLAGCDPRPPITRTEVGSLAANLLVREGLAWGDPREVLPPVEHEGRRWWQVSYGSGRIVLVDADSGWSRFPPEGFVVRRAPPAAQSAPPDAPVAAGSWVVILLPSAARPPAEEAALENHALRLNAKARETGLAPLFSVRTDRQGRTALVYGWQGDGGIAQDDRVMTWIAQRAPEVTPAWVDLLAQDR